MTYTKAQLKQLLPVWVIRLDRKRELSITITVPK